MEKSEPFRHYLILPHSSYARDTRGTFSGVRGHYSGKLAHRPAAQNDLPGELQPASHRSGRGPVSGWDSGIAALCSRKARPCVSVFRAGQCLQEARQSPGSRRK